MSKRTGPLTIFVLPLIIVLGILGYAFAFPQGDVIRCDVEIENPENLTIGEKAGSWWDNLLGESDPEDIIEQFESKDVKIRSASCIIEKDVRTRCGLRQQLQGLPDSADEGHIVMIIENIEDTKSKSDRYEIAEGGVGIVSLGSCWYGEPQETYDVTLKVIDAYKLEKYSTSVKAV
jgi:hypothetical protein